MLKNKQRLTTLFNLIITTSIYPNEWKCAHITPIYKGKGSKTSLDNYRPISILSPVSKLFESLISVQIYHYFESNNILHPSQFGFRQKLSCELDLNSMIEDWRECLDADLDVIAVFLDLSKTFDTVNHELLAYKLEYYNFGNSSLNLLKTISST